MSNFFFPHSVFKRLVLPTRKNQGLFGKGLKKDGSEIYIDASYFYNYSRWGKMKQNSRL